MFLMCQYSTGLFSCFLLLLPCFSSTCRQTNDDKTQNDPDDCLSFSRIQSLHHLLEVDFHDEEDGSISSTLHNRRANIFLVQHRSKFFPNRSSSCGCFAVPFDRCAKPPAINFNAYSSNCISGFLARCRLVQIRDHFTQAMRNSDQ